ncbi:hypothetical protein AXF42_Ash018068 [Apostasia shenzhenica]|uniref:Uncharacterized protein n=1 Tax=Apostasia shenzhenica TaxID=1088818 RepID=A0A2I0AVN3_9ASPA|nr:hypothetical protein AXF42_Ash018068 [Apostasia shenzhenica]
MKFFHRKQLSPDFASSGFWRVILRLLLPSPPSPFPFSCRRSPGPSCNGKLMTVILTNLKQQRTSSLSPGGRLDWRGSLLKQNGVTAVHEANCKAYMKIVDYVVMNSTWIELSLYHGSGVKSDEGVGEVRA